MRALTAFAIASLATFPALAQGLSDARSQAAAPNPQAAAVDDATSVFVNPAGLGAVTGVELGAGYRSRATVGGADQTGDGVIAIEGPLGTLGVGVTTDAPLGGRVATRLVVGSGLQLDDNVLIGAAMHLVDGRPSVDLGAQLRLTRGLAFGVVGEGFGDASAIRMGLSIRPLDELLTLGIDGRFKPAPLADPGQALLAGDFTPAFVARLHLWGLTFGAGVELQNTFGIGPITATATAILQADFEHVGLALQGGATGLNDDITTSVFGGRARVSTAAWETLLPSSGRWLELRLAGSGGVVDERDGLWQALLEDAPPSAVRVLAELDNAAEDPSVDGVLLRLEGLSMGFGTAAELRAAIERLRLAEKKVAVALVGGDDLDAWVASAADRVWLVPSSGLAVDGVRGRLVYLREALARFGVRAEAVSAGRYKSAPRTFTHDGPSDEELEVEAALLDGAYDALVKGLATGRGKSEDEIKALIDMGGVSAQEALDRGLVDALAYADELPNLLAELAGRPGQRLSTEQRFWDRHEKIDRWAGRPRIAVVPISGTIQMGSSAGGLFQADGAGADDVVGAINAAARDDSVTAIVLRIDSPGGDALASDLMWRAAMQARDKKPVIASLGDVAASGGYYVASAANDIIAEPNTITGSIGVFGLLFNAESLAADLGVRSVEVSRGALPGPDLLRGATDAEKARLQESVDQTYERFLDAIITGRGEERLKKDALREIAEGRVWTGAQALERKLVDQHGSIIDAIRLARERSGLPATEEIELAIFTGKDDLPGLGALGSVVQAATGMPRTAALERAAVMLFGDPAVATLAAQSHGRPLVLAPTIIVR